MTQDETTKTANDSVGRGGAPRAFSAMLTRGPAGHIRPRNETAVCGCCGEPILRLPAGAAASPSAPAPNQWVDRRNNLASETPVWHEHQPGAASTLLPCPAAPDHWTPWLRLVEARADQDPNDAQRELADALANAGFPALAQAVHPPATATEAAWRYARWYGVVGFDVEGVLDRRPDLTTEQAEWFLARFDNALADSVQQLTGEVLADYLSDRADGLPHAPADEILEDLVDARAAAKANGEPHDPILLAWVRHDELLNSCKVCGACDFASGGLPHEECRLTNAYYNATTDEVRCAPCFERWRARRRALQAARRRRREG
jgi:hypothetical protein